MLKHHVRLESRSVPGVCALARSLARSAHEAGKALLSMMALLPGRRTWQVFFLTVLSKASHALCILRAPQMRAKKAHDNGAASRKAIDRRLLGGKG